MWPFLYFADDRLSTAELTSARLDGDLVELGDAFLPADAVETAELRAASLRACVPDTLAVTRTTAAWVHGAIPEAPVRHCVQRMSATRLHHVRGARLDYRERLLTADAVTRIGGVWVTTPERTLADLARALQAGEPTAAAIEQMIVWRPHLVTAALALLAQGPRTLHKRPAQAYLRARWAGAAQEEVTR
ncbi:MAG TPA: SAM-dependent methyltransferase [Microbacterium sp.]|nr:SAM-dependent methyltransferase [Microbacterium sp.]